VAQLAQGWRAPQRLTHPLGMQYGRSMELYLSRRKAGDLAGLPPLGEDLPKRRHCFCGCGRKVPFGVRPVNTRGRQVRARLARMGPVRPEATDRDGDVETRAWFAEGELIADEIAEIVHGDRDRREVDEKAVREWQAIGREAELAVIASGLSEEETARAIARGEIKPFAED
jgi:hypothetical protein